jgi:hypothetical protein
MGVCHLYLLKCNSELHLHVYALSKDDPTYLQRLMTNGVRLHSDLNETAAQNGAPNVVLTS